MEQTEPTSTNRKLAEHLAYTDELRILGALAVVALHVSDFSKWIQSLTSLLLISSEPVEIPILL